MFLQYVSVAHVSVFKTSSKIKSEVIPLVTCVISSHNILTSTAEVAAIVPDLTLTVVGTLVYAVTCNHNNTIVYK